jgi:protein crumbs
MWMGMGLGLGMWMGLGLGLGMCLGMGLGIGIKKNKMQELLIIIGLFAGLWNTHHIMQRGRSIK